jgi:hypothetical protein
MEFKISEINVKDYIATFASDNTYHIGRVSEIRYSSVSEVVHELVLNPMLTVVNNAPVKMTNVHEYRLDSHQYTRLAKPEEIAWLNSCIACNGVVSFGFPLDVYKRELAKLGVVTVDNLPIYGV